MTANFRTSRGQLRSETPGEPARDVDYTLRVNTRSAEEQPGFAIDKRIVTIDIRASGGAPLRRMGDASPWLTGSVYFLEENGARLLRIARTKSAWLILDGDLLGGATAAG